jgi:MoxR-like ATPase
MNLSNLQAAEHAAQLATLVQAIAGGAARPALDEAAVERVTLRVVNGLLDEQRKALGATVPHAQAAQFVPSPSYTRTATCDALDKALRAAKRSGKRLVIVSGPSGSSKTFAARHALGRLGLDQYTVECSGATTTEDLIARPWTNADGRLVWVEQAMTRAARLGGAVLLDEFDLVDARVLGRLHSILDCDPRLRLPSGEEFQAHDDFLVVACCNGLRRDTGGNYSVQSISSALLGRAVFVSSDYMTQSDEVRLYTAQGYSATRSEQVYKQLSGLRELFKRGQLSIPPSPRLGLAVLGAMAEGCDEREAWTIALLAGCDEKTRKSCEAALAAAVVA